MCIKNSCIAYSSTMHSNDCEQGGEKRKKERERDREWERLWKPVRWQSTEWKKND